MMISEKILAKNNFCVKIWKVWKYALGSFQDETTKKYDDIICVIRSFIFLQLVITNCFIVAGNIRHWNDHYTPLLSEHIRADPDPLSPRVADKHIVKMPLETCQTAVYSMVF